MHLLTAGSLINICLYLLYYEVVSIWFCPKILHCSICCIITWKKLKRIIEVFAFTFGNAVCPKMLSCNHNCNFYYCYKRKEEEALKFLAGYLGEKIGAVLSRILVLVRQAGKSHEFELGSTQFDCYVMFWSIVFEFPT